MATQPTCGQGLAARSPLLTKMAELTAAMAKVLETHTKALDLTDESAKQEDDAYQSLVRQHRSIAPQLHATGAEMTGYRDMAMGRHDMQAMASPAAVEVFEDFVNVEDELATLLQEMLERDRQMLEMMRGAG
jgi:methylthioribose-1-phosphate isomerase